MQYQVSVAARPVAEGVEVFLYTMVITANGFVQVMSPRTTCTKEELPVTLGNLTRDLFIEVARVEVQPNAWTQDSDYNREADNRYGPAK